MPVLADGYVETEYLLSGSAQTYAGPVTGPVVVASDDSRYVTRILVRHPTSPADFSGRVVVEPFNTSFGVDRDALWARVGGLLQAEGDAWIGVTTRAMGAAELGKLDSLRYAEIDFPVNDLAWDALRDIGALIKAGGPGSPLGHLAVRRVYLGGYSQSAVDIATFAMAFHAIGTAPRRLAVSTTATSRPRMPPAARPSRPATAWRPPMEHPSMRDVDVPVIEVQPQSDVEGFSAQLGSVVFVNPGSASVRRADSDFKRGRYRLYELAGAPHVARLDGCEGRDRAFRRRHSFGRRCACCSSGSRTRCRHRGRRGSACKATGRCRWRASTNTEIPSAACDHPTSTFRWRGTRPIRARDRCANWWVARRRCPPRRWSPGTGTRLGT